MYALNCTKPASPHADKPFRPAQHPIALLLNKAQTQLYVANAHSDTVSIINTATDTISDTILLRPTGAHGLPGVTPTDLALTPDENTPLRLPRRHERRRRRRYGCEQPAATFPPAGIRPPSSCRRSSRQLLVANAKGTQTRYPNPGYQQFSFAGQYDLNLIEGNVENIPVPNSASAWADTQHGAREQPDPVHRPIPRRTRCCPSASSAGKIKHVIYIIKENRTYDQVLGDLPQGNGDPALALFGKSVTPNLHALASASCCWTTSTIAAKRQRRRLALVHAGAGQRVRHQEPAVQLQRPGPQLRLRRHEQQLPRRRLPGDRPYGNRWCRTRPFHTRPRASPRQSPMSPTRPAATSGTMSQRRRPDHTATTVSSTLFGDNVSTRRTTIPADHGLQPAGHDLGGITDIDFRRFDPAYADSEGRDMQTERLEPLSDREPTASTMRPAASPNGTASSRRC